MSSQLIRRLNKMNKYQKFILERVVCYIKTDDNLEISSGKNPLVSYLNEKDEFVVKQDNNYNIKKHYILIGGSFVKSIELDGKKINSKEAPQNSPFYGKAFVVPVDFDNRAQEIKLFFADDLEDPAVLKLHFVEADHSIYDGMVQAEINKKICAEHKTGTDLVNIYWNLVSDKVEYSQLNLYVCSNGERLIGKYKETEATFKSITGLAFGTYRYEIIEFDKDGKEIARTGKIDFTLSQPHYDGNGEYTVII